MNGIRKYVIGLSLIGVFVAGLAGWLLIQASAVKADNTTYKTAAKVGEKLDRYVSTNNEIPANLSEVTKETVPSSISYTKLSDERYKFCVTYKAASSGFDASQVQTELMMRAYGMDASGFESEEPESSYLYIPNTHDKGQNCQTIKPYIYTPKTDPACNYDFTKGAEAYDDYLRCVRGSSTGQIQSDGNSPDFY